jgi:hypothetical protein
MFVVVSRETLVREMACNLCSKRPMASVIIGERGDAGAAGDDPGHPGGIRGLIPGTILAFLEA